MSNFTFKQRQDIMKASLFAQHAHRNQVRKYSGEPYIVHPEAVAKIVEEKNGTVAQIMAAWLHDTIEDTDVTFDDIVREFGQEVGQLVIQLTDVYTTEEYPHMNRAMRKQSENIRFRTISDDAKLVKVADIADNTRDIVRNDPGFAKLYLREKADLLEAMGVE